MQGLSHNPSLSGRFKNELLFALQGSIFEILALFCFCAEKQPKWPDLDLSHLLQKLVCFKAPIRSKVHLRRLWQEMQTVTNVTWTKLALISTNFYFFHCAFWTLSFCRFSCNFILFRFVLAISQPILVTEIKAQSILLLKESCCTSKSQGSARTAIKALSQFHYLLKHKSPWHHHFGVNQCWNMQPDSSLIFISHSSVWVTIQQKIDVALFWLTWTNKLTMSKINIHEKDLLSHQQYFIQVLNVPVSVYPQHMLAREICILFEGDDHSTAVLSWLHNCSDQTIQVKIMINLLHSFFEVICHWEAQILKNVVAVHFEYALLWSKLGESSCRRSLAAHPKSQTF